ncbi:MAG: hypothetical protein R2867_42530 [Caldilineaceae bacterium]
MRPAAATTGRTAANAAQSAPTVLDGPIPMASSNRCHGGFGQYPYASVRYTDCDLCSGNTQYEYIDTTDDGAWVQICCVENQFAGIYSDQPAWKLARSIHKRYDRMLLQPKARPLSRSAPQVTSQQPQNQNPTQANALSTGTLRLPTNRASTTYTAAEAGFTLTLPPTWLAIAEAQGLIKDNLKLVADENPQIAALLENQLSDMQRFLV